MSEPDFKPKALKAFERGLGDKLDPDDVGGKTGRRFGEELHDVDSDQLPESLVKRSEVFKLAADRTISTTTVCAAVMAWGGMNQRFSPKFFEMAGQGWLALADRIREGKEGLASAYDEFTELRDRRQLHGVGPAYFTKIIYFLMPRREDGGANAYIMDQWAGCSINLLTGKELVKMDVTRQWESGKDEPVLGFRVSDANTGLDYLRFCQDVDRLRLHFNLSPDQVDRAMIASGGRKKSSWRQYVIKHRQI